MWQQMLEYLQQNSASYFEAIARHITVSVSALVIAMLLGIPAAFLCVRFARFEKPATGLFGVLRIIPSLAVLLLLLPVMGTGIRPAVTALVLLAVPPILMNAVAGLQEVPLFMLETAAGCGMTSAQTWYKVRLPLALPMMLAGVKIALIEIIASATLAAKIGAGGLGEIIFTGLGLNRFDLLFIGGITVALLSIGSALLLEGVERIVLQYKTIH